MNFKHAVVAPVVLCTLFALPGPSLMGQSQEKANALLTEAIAEGKMAGAVVLITRDGETLFSTAVGEAQSEPSSRPMEMETVFDMASITKPVSTATAIMCLVDAGKIDPEAPVAKYWPAFGANGKETITITDLMLHRGGLIPDNSLRDYSDDQEKNWQNLANLKPTAKPGEKFAYSDVGFQVLGKVVEEVSGQPLDVFVQEHIFAPLKMTESTYNPPEPLQKRAASTEKVGGEWLTGKVHDPRAARMAGVAGHAGLFSTAADMTRYGQAMIQEGELDGVKIFSPATFKTMTTPRKVPRGLRALGWDVNSPYSSNRPTAMSDAAFGHGGFTGTVLWIDPQQKTVFVFLSNRLHPDGKGSVNKLAAEVADTILGTK